MKSAPETTKKGKLKNFRAKKVTLDQLEKLEKQLRVPSMSAVIKVAIAYLYENRKDVDGWEIHQKVLKKERDEKC